jgi:hypothetical protein
MGASIRTTSKASIDTYDVASAELDPLVSQLYKPRALTIQIVALRKVALQGFNTCLYTLNDTLVLFKS